MKKNITFALTLALMGAASTTAMADNVTTASNKTEFVNAWNGASNIIGAVDTIYVKYVDGGINTGSIGKTNAPQYGTVVIKGIPDENGNLPVLLTGFELRENEEGSDLSVIFEDISLQYRSGASASSGQIVYINKAQTFIKLLAFRNCEITNYSRTIFRSVPPAADADGHIAYGWLESLEVTGCDIHYANILESNAWACFVVGSPIDFLTLRNNTFYDMPYNKQVYSMSYITAETDRPDTQVDIENNNFFLASDKTNPLFLFDNCLGQMSSINIKNNIFMRPTWQSDFVSPQATTEVTDSVTGAVTTEKLRTQILRLSYGLVTIKDNIIDDTFRGDSWANGIKLDEDGEGAWVSADTVPGITPAEAELSWGDCAAPEAGDFTMWKGIKAYTLGEGGTAIGNLNNYSDVRKVKASFAIHIEGSKSATYTVVPAKDQYFAGDQVIVTLNTRGDLNTFKGWSDGSTDLVREILIESDVDLTASFEEIPYVAVWDFNELDRNNANITFPYTANFANVTEATMGLKAWNGTSFVDSTYVQSRNNKFDSDTIIYAMQLRSNFADSANHVIGDKGVFPYIKFPTEGLTNATVSAWVGTDNASTTNQLMDYSLDGENWTNFGSATITEAMKWAKFESALPAEALGQPVVYVRWTVDPSSPIVDGPAQVETGIYTYEFHYLGGIRVLSSDATAIESIQKDAVKGGMIFDVMGRKVAQPVAGQLYIQNGKKFIQK